MNEDLSNFNIKVLVLDVDGTLTDGKIYMGAQGEMVKAFSVKDGYAISHMLPQYGITPVVMTARNSQIVKLRCGELSILHCYQGIRDKRKKLEELAQTFHFKADSAGVYPELAYMGDDLIDLPAMKICALKACPFDAAYEIKKESDYVSPHAGGDGAVRDFVEWLIQKRH